MKTLRNEKGFALAFVLILAAISLAMTLAMLIMVGSGSYVSGQQKRFRTATEAGMGGAQVLFQLFDTRGAQTVFLDNNANEVLNSSLSTKINNGTTAWSGLDCTVTIDPSNVSTYDMRVDLGVYRVYMKIVDTVPGNSAADEGLIKTGVVNAGSGEVTVVSVPYLYTVEVLSQSSTNAVERSKLSVLYQY